MLGCIVWGDVYVGNFLRYNIRSMLSAGNLPALKRQGTVVFSIVTDAAGAQQMRSHPLFPKLEDVGDVEFTIVPDEIMGILSGRPFGAQLLYPLRDAGSLLDLLCSRSGQPPVHDSRSIRSSPTAR